MQRLRSGDALRSGWQTSICRRAEFKHGIKTLLVREEGTVQSSPVETPKCLLLGQTNLARVHYALEESV
ncbi:hypothetical protein RRG08_035562 [Elysia crispata]|uniref:Uncharacterized protein n=1 Tax=Elysia crispata TaxID=231223 RepID=A0AAE1B3Y0_9GAST|nr:hypothetical protein RRG08_035562 [Elysia crispata]